MTREEFIQIILDDDFYNKEKRDILWKNKGLNRTREIDLLLTKLADVGKPKTTIMIKVCSQGVNDEEKTRVFLPFSEINSNVDWFAYANALCVLVCGKRVWNTEKFVIEKDGVFADEMQKTYRFEERFNQMIAQLHEKYPGDKEKIDKFSETVYHMKNTLFRYQYDMTRESAIAGVGFMGATTKDEMLLSLNEKENHPEWKPFASQEEFSYIEEAWGIEPIAQTSRGGFWMEISWVYCL